MQQSIGERLQIARKHANIYQADAAEAMGLSRPSLSAIESGRRTVTAEEITRFAALYRVKVMELLYGFESEQDQESFPSQKSRLCMYVAEFASLSEDQQNQVIQYMREIKGTE